MLSLSKSMYPLQYADISIRKDKEFMKSLISKDYEAFWYADESLKNDKLFILDCMSLSPYVYSSIGSDLQYDPDIKAKYDKLWNGK
jgi:hypothetical protein